MRTAIVNLGSLNIDRTFRVARIARPGQTIAARSVEEFAGGKGANQSVALARAGASVLHAGKVGHDGRWLLEKLSAEGIDVRYVQVQAGATGQAIIQVDDAGENAILILPGANHEITPAEVDCAIESATGATWLLVQNETNCVDHAIRRARQRGMRVAFNPAPFDARVREYPLDLVHLLCVNQGEGAALAREEAPERIVRALSSRFAEGEIVLTVGAAGAWYRGAGVELHEPAVRVEALDTTAAGDTFLGYFLAGRVRGALPADCLRLASRAAALCVTRRGAMDSIPRVNEIATVAG
jgi:ribokinase